MHLKKITRLAICETNFIASYVSSFIIHDPFLIIMIFFRNLYKIIVGIIKSSYIANNKRRELVYIRGPKFVNWQLKLALIGWHLALLNQPYYIYAF